MADPPCDETVAVRVERVLPFGLLVSLEDGREGLIREREIAWTAHERQRWRERFKPGDALRAVVLGERVEQRIELSLRLAESDPWRNLVERYRLGARVDGTVTAIQPYGAFVELEPGVVGLLHRTRLPATVDDRPIDELFWVGDAVRVTVERLDTVHRRIGLSLARARLRRWEFDWSAAGVRPAPVPPDDGAGRAETTPAEHASAEPSTPTWRIVVVEDDPLHREALVRWFQRAGHAVRSAATAEAALELVEAEAPDLLLSDWGLPGMSGVEGILRVRSRWPAVRCAVMTDLTRTGDGATGFEQLRAQSVPILVKPLRPADLNALLLDSGELSPAALDNQLASDLAEPSLLDVLRAPLPVLERIDLLLLRQLRRTGATKVVLFVFDQVRRKVDVLAEAGDAPLNRAALADLIYSPVRDVAEDQRPFRASEVQEADPRVRYLRPLLSFRSCVGIPLPVQLAERYALFVFSARQAEPGQHLEEYSDATALALAALLERDRFHTQALDTQRLALLGQLSRALVHEVNHRLSPVNFAVTEVAQILKSMGLPERSAQQLERDLTHLRLAADDLSLSVGRLTETAQMFGRVMVQARDQIVPLEVALRETVALVRDMADRSHIRIALQIEPELPQVQVPSIQVQQMLLNVVINAVQQISLSAKAGHILLRVRQAQADGRRLIRIEVEDDGPGLHRELWERVFELGFTTRRKEGSGLGLYITRSLADALGARVQVAESFILWGSTFVIELPAPPPAAE
jgi:signal transduction histidine kinase/predicted RNA-binding protein with RPS1 domain